MTPEPVDDRPVDPEAMPPPSRADHQRRWDIAVVIAAGGAVGGAMRHGVSLVLDSSSDGFPWATFVENVTGCLLLAVLMVYLIEVWPPSRYVRPFLGVGVLGGFTTFSTYMNETRELLLGGRPVIAFGYVAATLVVGLLATWTGLRLARRLAGVPGRR
jgi:fluoride exporter